MILVYTYILIVVELVVMDTAWADSLQIQQLILITFGMFLLLS